MDFLGETTCVAALRCICSLYRPAVSAQGRGRRRWSTGPRCLGHGAHVLSGKQTPEGRQRIANATRRRMLSFWEAWRKAGKPPLPWRESLRTARARPKPRWRNGEQRSSGSGTRTPSSAESGSSRACGSGSRKGVSDTTKIGQNPTVSIPMGYPTATRFAEMPAK